MANTEVRISLQGEVFVPSVSSVPIVAGDTVTFFADPNIPTNLCMTAVTAAVFSPPPSVTVTIGAGSSTTFEFLAAGAGSYCILTQGADWPYPNSISCGGGGAPVLAIQPGKPPIYSGPEDDTKT